ncbi:MAG: hypothetical protein V3U17_07315 [Thermoplasmata archaeon]
MNRGIASRMREDRVFHPPEDLSKKAHVSSLGAYEQLYRESVPTR